MKRKIYLPGIILILILSSCEDTLDRKAVLSIREQLATEVYANTQASAYAIYRTLPEGFLYVDGAMMASASDEAEHTLETSNVQKFNTGAWNAVDNPDNAWSNYFLGIRRANYFLTTADSVNLDRYKLDPTPSQQTAYQTRLANIKSWKYEARFLRAFFYFELVKRYGGVPLITTALTLNDDYKDIPRSTLAQCLQFITDECDSAAKNLVVTYATGDLGHVTKGAAMALKSRVLLYAASDLFNTTSWAGGYSNPELISLTGSSRVARWDSAARAAKRVLDLTGTGYSLVTAANYVGLFKTFNSTEIILTRRNTGTNTFEKASYPVGYDLGNSGTTPSQNLVDDFEVKINATTAVPFDWNNPVHAANPFSPVGTLGRDPRLAYNILLNNTTFKGRPVECWTGGLDGSGKVLATKTGYYLFKYVDPNVDLLLNTTSVHSWLLIRLAEIYLNYAEAMNEAYGPYVTGPAPLTMTAQQAVNTIRTRATMPNIPAGLSQSQMRDAIRHEHRIEFAFEDHRLWDVRRWMLGTTYFNVPLRGLRITKNPDATFGYQVINVENRVFEPKMYFYPIPQTDLNIAKGWVQNPLW